MLSRSSGRGRLARLALASGVFTVGLSVMAAPAANAVGFGLPVAIGTAIDGVAGAAAVEETGAALAPATGGASLVLSTLVVGGIIAYQTHDTWVPLLADLLGKNTPAGPSGSTGSTCAVSSSDVHVDDSTHYLSAYILRSGCVTANSSSAMRVQNYVCSTGTGYVQNPGPVYVGASTPVPGNGSTYVYGTPCGAGTTLTSAWVEFRTGSNTFTPLVYVQGTVPDAAITATTKVVCKLPDGSTQVLTATITGEPDKLPIPSCRGWDPGSRPVDVESVAGVVGSTPHSIFHVIEKPDFMTNYGDCFDASGLICSVKVYVGGDPCSSADPACANWQQYAIDHPAAVKCKFGSHVVGLGNCDMLANAYQAAGTTTTVVADPDGTIKPSGSTGTGTSTGSSSFPTEGPNPTGPGVTIDGSTDPDSQSCFGTGWSWNPVSWVYVPVKCALKWAFVPANAPSFTDVPSPLPPGWLPSMPDLGSSPCGVVTMPRLSLGFSTWAVGPTILFDSCAAPWPLVRSFTYNGLLAVVLVTAAWQAFRAVLGGLGMGVATGGGSDDE